MFILCEQNHISINKLHIRSIDDVTSVYEGILTMMEDLEVDDRLISIFHAKVDPESEV